MTAADASPTSVTIVAVHRPARPLQLSHVHVRIRRGQPGDVSWVAGEHDTAPRFHRTCNAVGVGKVLTPGTCGMKDPADEPGDRAVSVSHHQSGLTAEAGVDERIPIRRPIEVCQRHGRHEGRLLRGRPSPNSQISKFASGRLCVVPLQIRSAVGSDQAFLEDMTFEAIFVRPDTEPFGREILDDPSIRHYFDEFGRRPGDTGLVALDGDQPVGAVWVRRFSAADPGYGWVDEHTPELTIALAPSHRNLGLGTQLLTALFEALAEQDVAQLCLSVDDISPARALYRRLGFVEVAEEGTAVTMLRQLP